MARNKLTDKFIRSSLEPGRYSDGAGLYLRVRDTGRKGFIVLVNVAGKRQEVTIGPYGARAGEFSLAAAREEADNINRRAKSGESLRLLSPASGSTDERLPEIPSFGNFAIEVLDSIEAEFRNPKHAAQWRSTLTTYCEAFWSKPVDQIRTDDVLDALKPIWVTKSETASRVRGRIERILCQSARKVDPLSASNVAPHGDDQHLDRPALAGVAEGEPGAGDGALRL